MRRGRGGEEWGGGVRGRREGGMEEGREGDKMSWGLLTALFLFG